MTDEVDSPSLRFRDFFWPRDLPSDDLGTPDYECDQKMMLEVLGRLHALEVERFYERRRLEWQFAFSLWAAASVVGLGVVSNAGALDIYWRWVVIAGFGAVFVMHWIIECVALAPGAKRGRDNGYKYAALQRTAIGLSDAEPSKAKYRYFLAHLWMPTITLLLVVNVAIVLLFSVPIR